MGDAAGPSIRDKWTDIAEGPNRHKERKSKRKDAKRAEKEARIAENQRRAEENRRAKMQEQQQRQPRPTTGAATAARNEKRKQQQQQRQPKSEKVQQRSQPIERPPRKEPKAPVEGTPFVDHDVETPKSALKKPAVAPTVAELQQSKPRAGAKRVRVAIPTDLLNDVVDSNREADAAAAPVQPLASSSATVSMPSIRVAPTLQREVLGICNKLTVNNVAVMARSLFDLFEIKGNARADVVDAFCVGMRGGLLQHTALTSAIAVAYTGIIRALQLKYGNAAAARVFDFVGRSAEASLANDDDNVSKNSGTLVAHMLLVHCTDHAMTTTFIRRCVQHGTITSLQAALAAVRAAGDRLRADCPTELNQLVDHAQRVLKSCEGGARGPDFPVVRLSVFVDVLRGIAAGKTKTSANMGAVGEVDRASLNAVSDALRDFVASMEGSKAAANKRALTKAVAGSQVLRCSFGQCAALEKPAQWWTQVAPVGGDEEGDRRGKKAHRPENPESDIDEEDEEFDDEEGDFEDDEEFDGDEEEEEDDEEEMDFDEEDLDAFLGGDEGAFECDDGVDEEGEDFDEEDEEEEDGEGYPDDPDVEDCTLPAGPLKAVAKKSTNAVGDDNGDDDEDFDDEWEGFEEDEDEEEGDEADDAGDEEDEEEDEEDLAAARKRRENKQLRTVDGAMSGQRLSTELRRRIFSAIASSHDDTDCFHRLMALGGANATNLNDIAAVTIQCAMQDSVVNGFYARVLQRLVSGQKKFKTVLQFALWDRFKAFAHSPVDVCGYVNLAALVTFLFSENLFALPLLRGLDVDSGLGKNEALFLRILLLRVLLELDARRIADLFFGVDPSKKGADAFGDHLTGSKAKAAMRKALLKFLKLHFIDEEAAKAWMPALIDVVGADLDLSPQDIDQLAAKMRIAKRALQDGA